MGGWIEIFVLTVQLCIHPFLAVQDSDMTVIFALYLFSGTSSFGLSCRLILTRFQIDLSKNIYPPPEKCLYLFLETRKLSTVIALWRYNEIKGAPAEPSCTTMI